MTLKDSLNSILAAKLIEAKAPFGLAVRRLDSPCQALYHNLNTEKAVCFDETPL